MDFLTNLTGLVPELIDIIEDYCLPAFVETCFADMPNKCIIPISKGKIVGIGDKKVMVNDKIIADFDLTNVSCCKELYNKNIAICAGNCLHIWDRRKPNFPVYTYRLEDEKQTIIEILELDNSDIVCSTTISLFILHNTGYGRYTREDVYENEVKKATTHMKQYKDEHILCYQNNNIVIQDIYYLNDSQIINRYLKSALVELFVSWPHIICVFEDGSFVKTNRYIREEKQEIIYFEEKIKECHELCGGKYILLTQTHKVFIALCFCDERKTNETNFLELKSEMKTEKITTMGPNIVLWGQNKCEIYDKKTYIQIKDLDFHSSLACHLQLYDGTLFSIDNNQFKIYDNGDNSMTYHHLPIIGSGVCYNNKLLLGIGNEIVVYNKTNYSRLFTMRFIDEQQCTHAWLNDEDELMSCEIINGEVVEMIYCWDVSRKMLLFSTNPKVLIVKDCLIHQTDEKENILISCDGKSLKRYKNAGEFYGCPRASIDKVLVLSENEWKLDMEIKEYSVNRLVRFGENIISGSTDGEIVLWNMTEMKCLYALPNEHKRAIIQLSIIRGICKTKYLLSVDDTKTACFWDVGRRKLIARVPDFAYKLQHIGGGKFIETQYEKAPGVRLFI